MTLLLLTSLCCAFGAGWFTCLGVQDLRRAREIAAAERAAEEERSARAITFMHARGYPTEWREDHDTTPWGERLRPGR